MSTLVEFNVDDRVDALRRSEWRTAIIKNKKVKNNNTIYLVHFEGLKWFYDEWLSSHQLRPLHNTDDDAVDLIGNIDVASTSDEQAPTTPSDANVDRESEMECAAPRRKTRTGLHRRADRRTSCRTR